MAPVARLLGLCPSRAAAGPGEVGRQTERHDVRHRDLLELGSAEQLKRRRPAGRDDDLAHRWQRHHHHRPHEHAVLSVEERRRL